MVTIPFSYRRALLDPTIVESIYAKRDELQGTLNARDKEATEKLAKELTKSCEGFSKRYRHSGIAENVEAPPTPGQW